MNEYDQAAAGMAAFLRDKRDRAARLALARDAWTDALLRGDYDAADAAAAEVAELKAGER